MVEITPVNSLFGDAMSSHSHQRASFLIRIWREPRAFDADERGVWRAHIQHVQSGESRYVDDLMSLIAFLEEWSGALQNDARPNNISKGERFHET
ncbi:MAG: hypothetical protein GXP42_01270 [Chloroflexi bacterium]|nr:hypothetical protein [Chloroflexota bacterium]